MGKQENEEKISGLSRRDWLKVMTAGPMVAMLPVAPLGAESPSAGPVDTAGGTYKPKFFTRHQYQTLAVLSDLIIPADDRSGSATEARVPEFIDDLLGATEGRLPVAIFGGRVGWFDIGTAVLGGLTWIDMESKRLYGRDFIDTTAPERKQLLDRIAYPNKAAPENSNAVAAFNHIRDLVVGGFFSSEMGVKDLPYLGNKVEPDWKGCPERDLDQLGVSYNVPWMNWNELKMKV
jgi:gluconate 2-dehydrogenase gamma chain